MKNEPLDNVFSIYKKLLAFRNLIEFSIKTNTKINQENNPLNIVFLNIENTLKILEKSNSHLSNNDDDFNETEYWLNEINRISPHNTLILTDITDNIELISKILNKIKEKLNQSPSITNIMDDTIFKQHLTGLKINADTQIFSNLTENEISNIKIELKKTKDSYERVNSIYEDIRKKNEKFNYFIDSENNEALKKLYDKIYDIEIKYADDYRTYAIVIFMAIGFLIFFIILSGIMQNLSHIQEPSKYMLIKYDFGHLIRLIGILSLTAPAWYFTKESGKHRLVAYKAKILGTELTAFPHYVKELSSEDRINMRKQLADKFFGQELYTDKNNNATASVEQSKVTIDALKTVTSLLSGKNSSSGPNSPQL